MKNALLTLGFVLALPGLACDSEEQCVADCDAQGSSGQNPDTGSGGSGGASLVCGEARDEATEFVQENRDCETVLDCVSADGICYQGDVSNPCGTLALSVEADLGAWQTIVNEMSSECPCSAAACGPTLMCNAAQQCEATFGSEEFCPNIARDVETFLASSRACEVDDDCMQLPSTCRVDDCSVVAVNVNTDPEDWAQLDNTLWGCGFDDAALCNFVGDCGAEHRCSDAGFCETVR